MIIIATNNNYIIIVKIHINFNSNSGKLKALYLYIPGKVLLWSFVIYFILFLAVSFGFVQGRVTLTYQQVDIRKRITDGNADAG